MKAHGPCTGILLTLSKAKEVKAVLAADRSHRYGPEPQLAMKMYLSGVSSV